MGIKAKLTTFDTTMIVVSLVIGIGIFRVPAMVAAATRTPLLFFLAWGAGGLISLFGGLTFAEVGSRFNKPGSYYKVIAEGYNSQLAFMFNWVGVLIVFGAGAAAVAMIGAEYLNPIILPLRLQSQTAVQLSAAAILFVLFVINYLGIKTGAWAQNLLTLFKVGMILLLVFVAFRYSGFSAADQLKTLGSVSPLLKAVLPGFPIIPGTAPGPSGPWWIALALGFIPVFYTYGGYQCTINFGADVKDARRNMPRAILSGVAIIIACYLLINVAYMRVLGIAGMAGAKLVAAEVARMVFGPAGHLIISLAIVLSAMGFLNATLMQIPRAYYAMAEDRVLPPIFKRVNPRTQTQEFGLAFFCADVLISIFFLGTFENIVNAVMFVDCLNIAVVASTIFILRKRARLEEPYDGYKVPLYPIIPAIFVLFLVMISLNVLLSQTRTALFGAAIFLTGWPMFLLMRRVSRVTPPE
jgi:APA family basic amino acid/polyamine antiporter